MCMRNYLRQNCSKFNDDEECVKSLAYFNEFEKFRDTTKVIKKIVVDKCGSQPQSFKDEDQKKYYFFENCCNGNDILITKEIHSKCYKENCEGKLADDYRTCCKSSCSVNQTTILKDGKVDKEHAVQVMQNLYTNHTEWVNVMTEAVEKCYQFVSREEPKNDPHYSTCFPGHFFSCLYIYSMNHCPLIRTDNENCKQAVCESHFYMTLFFNSQFDYL